MALVDITSAATITCDSYHPYLHRLVDGQDGSGVLPINDRSVSTRTYSFTFAAAQTIEKIIFWMPTNTYTLSADTTGNGAYDTELVAVTDQCAQRTDGATSGIGVATFTSATGGFTADMVGSKIVIASGTNVTAGDYFITGHTDTNTITLASAPDDGGGAASSVVFTVDFTYIGTATWSKVTWMPGAPLVLYAVQLVTDESDDTFNVEIYADDANIAEGLVPTYPLTGGVTAVGVGDVVAVAAPAIADQYQKGVYIEAWMFDWEGWINGDQVAPLADWPAFQDMLGWINDVGANTIILMPVRTWQDTTTVTFDSSTDILTFTRPINLRTGATGYGSFTGGTLPTKTAGSTQMLASTTYYLRQLGSYTYSVHADSANALANTNKFLFDDNGSGTITWTTGGNLYQSPFPWASSVLPDDSSADYLSLLADALHATGLTLYVQCRPTPGCIDTNGDDALQASMLEAIATSVDGVGITYDDNSTSIADYGLTARVIANAVRAASTTKTLIGNYIDDDYRYPVADQMLHTFGCDLTICNGYNSLPSRHGHWHTAREVKIASANNPSRGVVCYGAGPWEQGGGGDGFTGTGDNPLYYVTDPPVMKVGNVLSTVMHAKAITWFWRLRQAMFWNGYDAHVKTGNDILDTLTTWGIKDSTEPREILVLDSNVGNMAYYAKADAIAHDRVSATICRDAIMETLFCAGLPFEYRYVDYPLTDTTYKTGVGGRGDVPDLSHAKVIILSWPHSHSSFSFVRGWPASIISALETVAAGGTKVFVVGRTGCTYVVPTSDFDTLVADDNTTLLQQDYGYGLTATDRAALLDPVVAALGTDRPTFLNAYGQDIEVTSRNMGDDRFLMAANFSGGSATIDLGVNVPANNTYTVLQRDLTDVNDVTFGGSRVWTKAQLMLFRITLAENEVRVFYVRKRERNRISFGSGGRIATGVSA